MISNIIDTLFAVKIQDDLLIVFFALIIALMLFIIFLVVRSILFRESLEKILMKKMKARDYNGVIQLAKETVDKNFKKKKGDTFFIIYYLAQAYEAQESYANAMKYYKDASVLTVKNKKFYSDILLKIAKISERTGKQKEAMSYYLMLLEQDEFNCDALFELAQIQYKNKNYKKAREYLEKLLKKKGGLLDARILYGKIQYEACNYQSALKQFELLERHDHDNVEVYYFKAKILENIKRYADAVKAYKSILKKDWDLSKNANLPAVIEECQISIINLYIKIKDYFSGIQTVSEYLSHPSSEKTKTELIYLYANLLWNTGEEYQALKNFERVYMMKPDFKDTGIMYERYKKILPHSYLSNYFTSIEEENQRSFDSCCRKILGKHNFNLQYRHLDYYIYSKGVFFIVFYRHIEPIPFSKLTDVEVIMNSFKVKPQSIEIYSLSGVRDDSITHYLLKNSRLIEGDEFIKTVKKSYSAKDTAI